MINGAYEINRRFVFAMRLLGKGFQAMKLFCGIMDLPTVVAQKPFDAAVTNIEVAAKAVAVASMKVAAEEEKKLSAENNKIQLSPDGIIVSANGTWMKQGVSSLLGVVTLIGHFSGKVIDFLVKSITQERRRNIRVR